MTCDCPNCGNIIQNEVCDNCGFNFNDSLNCPYKVSLKCIFTNNECKITGLNYEDCKVYLHKSGIIR